MCEAFACACACVCLSVCCVWLNTIKMLKLLLVSANYKLNVNLLEWHSKNVKMNFDCIIISILIFVSNGLQNFLEKTKNDRQIVINSKGRSIWIKLWFQFSIL